MKYKVQKEKILLPKIKLRKVKGGVSGTGRTNLSDAEVVSEKAGTYKAAKTKITAADDFAQLSNVNP